MRKFILLLGFFISISAVSKEQTQTIVNNNKATSVEADSIISKKNLLGYSYYFKSNKLNISSLKDILKMDKLATAELDHAESINSIAMIFGGAGGFMIGWPIGAAMGGGKANWSLVGIGVGLVAISIPITVSAEKHAKNAVDIFNNGIKKTAKTDKELLIGFTGNGIGLRFQF